MLRKILSSIGTGEAKADTPLGADSSFPGEMVSGEAHITGGGDARELNRIYISVVTTCKHDDLTHEYTLAGQDVSGSLRIEANENHSIPFTVNLPRDTTLARLRVGLRQDRNRRPERPRPERTGRDASRPRRYPAGCCRRRPEPRLQAIQVENEYSPSKGYPYPFVQQLEFRPSGGRYAGRVEELKLIFKPRQDGLDVLVELDWWSSSLGALWSRR